VIRMRQGERDVLNLYTNYKSYPTQAEMLPGCVLVFPRLFLSETSILHLLHAAMQQVAQPVK
jgi:hypothetical protein